MIFLTTIIRAGTNSKSDSCSLRAMSEIGALTAGLSFLFHSPM